MEGRRSLTLKDDENYNSILGFILMCQCANHRAKYKNHRERLVPEEADKRHCRAKNINNFMQENFH